MPKKILDQAIIEDLKSLSDGEHPDFFWNQVVLFKMRGEALAGSLEVAVRDGDINQVRRTAHALAGSAATVGASSLKNACLSLESHCLFSEPSQLAIACTNIQGELEAAEEQLMIEAGDVYITIERL